MANPERNSTSRHLLGALSLRVVFQPYLKFSTLRASEGWSVIRHCGYMLQEAFVRQVLQRSGEIKGNFPCTFLNIESFIPFGGCLSKVFSYCLFSGSVGG